MKYHTLSLPCASLAFSVPAVASESRPNILWLAGANLSHISTSTAHRTCAPPTWTGDAPRIWGPDDPTCTP